MKKIILIFLALYFSTLMYSQTIMDIPYYGVSNENIKDINICTQHIDEVFKQNNILNNKQMDLFFLDNRIDCIYNNVTYPNKKIIKWNWDTIVTYDTIGLKQRHTQIFDSNGNVLCLQYENWQTNVWEKYQKKTYTYNTNGNILSELYEQLENNIWIIKNKSTFQYNTDEKLLIKLVETCYDNVWRNQSRYSYTYNIYGERLTYLSETWESSQWIIWDKMVCTYDTNRTQLTLLHEIWQNNNLTNYSSRITNTYDSNNQKVASLQENWQNNTWVNYVRDFYINDSLGNIKTDLKDYWQNNSWVKFAKETYTYNSNGHALMRTSEQWQNNSYVNNSKNTYNYDIDGNKLFELWEIWQNNSWSNICRYNYTYDANKNSISGKFEKWQSNNLSYLNLYSNNIQIYSLFNIFRYEASYNYFNTNIKKVNRDNSFIVYPNPASKKINVKSLLFEQNEFTISIYNVQGQLCFQQMKIKECNDIDISRFSNGIYFVKISISCEEIISIFEKK